MNKDEIRAKFNLEHPNHEKRGNVRVYSHYHDKWFTYKKSEEHCAYWYFLKKQYNFTCLCCKRKEPDITLTQDHIVPLSKCGAIGIENIQPLCRECNTRKHNKTIDYRPP